MKSNYVTPTIALCCMTADVVRTSGIPETSEIPETAEFFNTGWLTN